MPNLPLSDEDLGSVLRAQLNELAGDMFPPNDLCATLVRQHQRRRRRSWLAGGLAALATAAVTVPLSIGAAGGGGVTRAQVRLASFTFQLPAGYRVTSSTTKAPCSMVLGVPFPAPHRPAFGPPGLSVRTKMKSAANAVGGCLTLLLTEPFKVGKAAPVPAASARSVRVGPYQAWEGHLPWSEGPVKIWALYVQVPYWPAKGHAGRVVFRQVATALVLDVRMPVGNGEDRDLLVVSRGLSEQRLTSVVMSGLSL